MNESNHSLSMLTPTRPNLLWPRPTSGATPSQNNPRNCRTLFKIVTASLGREKVMSFIVGLCMWCTKIELAVFELCIVKSGRDRYVNTSITIQFIDITTFGNQTASNYSSWVENQKACGCTSPCGARHGCNFVLSGKPLQMGA